MPRTSKKKKRTKASAGVSGGSEISPPLDPLRRGMPAQDSIISVKEMKRAGKVFRVIKTDEIDEYEEPLAKGRQKRH
jgi:hypothetical protein